MHLAKTMLQRKRRLVVDNSLLDSFYLLGSFETLNLYFEQVLIPVTVEREFLANDHDAKKFQFIMSVYARLTWVKKCQTFDQDIVLILAADKKMHPGETEVLAQVSKLEMEASDAVTHFAGIDEKYGRGIAKARRMNIAGTLIILARYFYPDDIQYRTSISTLRSHGKRFRSSVVNEALEIVKRQIAQGILW